MNKEECLNAVSRFFGEDILCRSFLGKKREEFIDTFEKVKKIITVMENDGIPQNYHEKEIKQSLSYLKNICMENPIGDRTSSFIRAWCELMSNVNNNTLKNEQIQGDAMFITRIIDQHLTVVEAIDIMKQLNKKMRDLKQWNPPAFEVAKHYLNYLED